METSFPSSESQNANRQSSKLLHSSTMHTLCSSRSVSSIQRQALSGKICHMPAHSHTARTQLIQTHSRAGVPDSYANDILQNSTTTLWAQRATSDSMLCETWSAAQTQDAIAAPRVAHGLGADGVPSTGGAGGPCVETPVPVFVFSFTPRPGVLAQYFHSRLAAALTSSTFSISTPSLTSMSQIRFRVPTGQLGRSQ